MVPELLKRADAILQLVIPVAVLSSQVFADERINHEGRLLGQLPTVTSPTLFNTPEADAILSAMQIMPVNSPWNENIPGRPLLANSDAMIAQIIADFAFGSTDAAGR